ncbi:hypothetical protein C0J52_21574 [Blattella germanica]|nr:hypothetical protein C0J52_21574 [Blattella germanica]
MSKSLLTDTHAFFLRLTPYYVYKMTTVKNNGPLNDDEQKCYNSLRENQTLFQKEISRSSELEVFLCIQTQLVVAMGNVVALQKQQTDTMMLLPTFYNITMTCRNGNNSSARTDCFENSISVVRHFFQIIQGYDKTFPFTELTQLSKTIPDIISRCASDAQFDVLNNYDAYVEVARLCFPRYNDCCK